MTPAIALRCEKKTTYRFHLEEVEAWLKKLQADDVIQCAKGGKTEAKGDGVLIGKRRDGDTVASPYRHPFKGELTLRKESAGEAAGLSSSERSFGGLLISCHHCARFDRYSLATFCL